MAPYRVFISSIMNRLTEDLVAERAAACSSVKQFAPITIPWAFEEEPASSKPLLDFYIDAVKTSDLFVLILGQHLTQPVKYEYDTARDYGKPVLAFCKTVSWREPEADELLRSLNAKYDAFATATELRDKISKSLGLHLLSLIRREGDEAIQPQDRLAQLRAFVRSHRQLKILPTVPYCRYNSFWALSVDAPSVTFNNSNDQDVIVPSQRIEDVLEAVPHEPATVQLDGRLQWLTLRERWRFFPEKPPLPDPLCIGFGKQVASHGDYINRIGVQLKESGYSFRWSNPGNVPSAEAFFDEDGLHLTNGSQILTCSKDTQALR